MQAATRRITLEYETFGDPAALTAALLRHPHVEMAHMSAPPSAA